MKVTVRAAELATLLDQAPDGLRYLSLDCFDTLVWRNVQAPRDVFADLPIAGGGVGPRMWAEQRARKSATFSERRNEVPIEEISHRMRPSARQKQNAWAAKPAPIPEGKH